MNAITSLIIANIAIWVGFAGYFLYLTKNQQNITKRLNSIASQINHD